jgi:ectoine hydroxylase-related dioxygenase (phytanoyl-CoA dioxygenase family)
VEELGLKPAYFTPKKGDVLIWHHNLLHGGSPRRVRSHTRKSVVCHFYASNVICYHDLSGDPAGVGVKA